MSDPVVGVLALQGDVREHAAALSRCGAVPRLVRRPAELTGLAGIVLPGGESTTIDKLSRLFGIREPLVASLQAGLPAFGSCAGMIMLADRLVGAPPDQQTFGGLDIAVRRNAFGRQVDSFEHAVDVAGLTGGSFPAVFIRAPAVETVGEAVEVLGRVADTPSSPERIVAVRQGPVIATAFHPEMAGDLRLHRFFVDLVRAAYS